MLPPICKERFPALPLLVVLACAVVFALLIGRAVDQRITEIDRAMECLEAATGCEEGAP